MNQRADHRAEVREFLRSRRARIAPEDSGLPAYGGNRRVAGLRREEVALLAGVSVDYYTRLERGNLGGVSDSVLGSLARALQLDDAERAYLFDLARAADPAPEPRRRHPKQRVRPAVQRVLDAMTDAPADVRNNRRDILASNRLGYALYSEMYADPARPVNVARFTFLSPRARAFFADWDGAASDLVANLRTEAGRSPTTAICPIWWASSASAARSSAPGGPRTTSASITAAPSACTIRSSVTCS